MVNYKELVEFIVKHLVTQPDSVVKAGERVDVDIVED